MNLTNCSTYNISNGDCEEYGDEFLDYFLIFEYCNYATVGLGVLGNIAAFITILNMKPFASFSVYMVNIAFADFIYLLITLQLTTRYFRMFDVGCKIIIFLANFAMHSSCWTLVSLTIERFIVVWFPLKASTICTKRNALLVNAITTLILIGLNLHFFWSAFEYSDPEFGFLCNVGSEYSHFIDVIWYWIDGTVYGFLPWTIIAVFNVMIVIGVKRSAKTRRVLTQKHNKNNMKDEQQIVVMAFTVSLVFLLLTIPSCIYLAIRDFDWQNVNNTQYLLVYHSVLVLSDLNHAVNFYLYFLSAQKFRVTFKSLICSVRKVRTRLSSSSTRDSAQEIAVTLSSGKVMLAASPTIGRFTSTVGRNDGSAMS